ncbi:unnamed protein product [Rotaria sordida]|uniref:Uncharacterized protein n=1 Tax=Rotaria sordida TaxID=392033 RepID=A0A819Q3J8_9BILA|nr:unnamed protein product [Rotaria sordida]
MMNIYNQSVKTSDILTVYRGMIINADELEKIKMNIGNLISINTFFSTTTLYNVALMFARDCSGRPLYESVVFEINIDTTIVKKPLVSLNDVEPSPSGHWYVSLTVKCDQETKTNELITYFKQEIDESSTLLQLGEFLGTMDEYDKHVLCIYQSDWILATTYLEKGLEPDLKNLKSDDPYLAITYKNIGVVYYNRGMYGKALENYEQALSIELLSLPTTNAAVGTTYNNMSLVYTDRGDYEQALDHLEKALHYKLLSLRKYHPNIGNTYNNIGLLHFDNHQYDNALENLQQALEILLICLPKHHLTTANLRNNIGLIYQKQGDQIQALDYFEKLLASMEISLPVGHMDFALVYNNMGLVQYEMKNWDQALAYYEKANQIYCQKGDSEHPACASIFHNMGDVYPDHQDIAKYRSKFSEIQLQIAQRIPHSNTGN